MTLNKNLLSGEYFRVHKGPTIETVAGLRAYLATIPQEIFAHHVSKKHNDFADWIEHAFEDPDLAHALRNCSTSDEMTETLKVALNAHLLPSGQQVDDKTFAVFRSGFSAHTEEMSERYDEIAKRLQHSTDDMMPKELEQQFDQLRSRFDEIAASISDARRQGKDTLLASLFLRQFQPKFALAKVTRDRGDIQRAAMILDDARLELGDALASAALDVKKEVEALAGVQPPSEKNNEKQTASRMKTS